MFAHRVLLAVVATAVGLTAVSAADPALPDGKYLLYYTPNASIEQRAAILDLKAADGKLAATVASGGPGNWKVSDLKQEDGLVTAAVVIGSNNLTFQGKVDAENKRILGTLGDDSRTFRAVIAPTDLEQLTQQNSSGPAKLPDSLAELNKLRSGPAVLQAQARRETDPDKRKELLDEAKAAKEKADAEAPKLLQKIVETETDPGLLFFTTPDLLGSVGTLKAKPEDVKKWADKGLAAAAAHGPKAEMMAVLSTADALASQEGMGEVALAYAEKAVTASEKGATGDKVRALKALATAQEKTGKADAAKATLASVDKLESALDEEYKKSALDFTPEKYAGRQAKEANRVAVLELFTGATCPPCVAADLAFDGLEQAYSPKELVLLQYHQHIPGPDPMTNPATLARWNYYRELFPNDIRGVPSSVFNGKPQAGGGGGKANAKSKFDQYKKIIDPILEETAAATVSGTATLSEGVVKVDATVSGKTDGATVRVLLAEEEVRYVGGNGIRLHHQVVRSMFGEAGGWKVKDLKEGKVSASVKLGELKTSLSEYMEKYNKEERPFTNPDRPLKLEHLKVIVLIQDDATGEILNAVQMEVEGKKS